jgi:CheY-like chemotaxis protein/MinD-like ATPase involved in chromosome partitioning or flagellar assembly
MARILVVDDDANLLQMVRLMLERVGHTVQTANHGERGIALAAESQPDLAVIDVMMPELSGYDVVRQMRENPRTARIPIVILTARSQPMDKHMALEAGANSFLSKPVSAQELTERVNKVLEAGVDFRVHTGLLTEPVPPRSASPAPGQAAGMPDRAPSKPRRLPIGVEHLDQPADIAPTRLPVIAALSLRGGTGCTTVAVNLACALAGQARRVCLVDLSGAGGHIQLHLHLTPRQHWGHLLNMGDAPDPRALRELLLAHPGSGLAVLAAPPLPTPERLSEDAMRATLRELCGEYNPVVIDAGTLDSATLGALPVSGLIVLVMTDDPPSAQTTGQTLVALQQMGIDPNRVRVVLNHVRPTSDVPAAALQKALKRPLVAELPYDAAHVQAIRQGVPLVIGAPGGAFGQAIQQLARALGV